MSSKKIICLYEELYKQIYNIFKNNGVEGQIKPFNIKEDIIMIESIFYENVPTSENKDFLSWTEEEWLEYIKLPKINYFSFLQKKNINLFKIYELCNDLETKNNFLQIIKTLTIDICMFKKMESVKQILLEKNLDSIALGQKKISLIQNIKNWKNPEFLANIVDLIYFKEFRENLISTVIDGVNMVDIEYFKKNQENVISSLVSNIDTYFTIDNFERICYFINNLDLNGTVYCSDFFKNIVTNYVNTFLKSSEQIKKILSNMENKTKNFSETNCKASVKIIKSDTKIQLKVPKTDTSKEMKNWITKNIKELGTKIKENKNPLIFDKNILDFSAIFEETQTKFTISNFKNKLYIIIFAIIEKGVELFCMSNEEKKILYEKYGRDMFIDFFNKSEEENILFKDDFKETENVLNFFQNGNLKENLKENLKTLSKSIEDNIRKDEIFKNFSLLKSKYVRRLKNLFVNDRETLIKKIPELLKEDLDKIIISITEDNDSYFKNKKNYVDIISNLLLEEITDNQEEVILKISTFLDELCIDIGKNKPIVLVKLDFLKNIVSYCKNFYGLRNKTNIFKDLADDLLSNHDQYKIFVMKLVNIEFIENLLNKAPGVFGVNIEEKYREKIKNKISMGLDEFINTTMEDKEFTDFNKFVFVIAKGLDFFIPKIFGLLTGLGKNKLLKK